MESHIEAVRAGDLEGNLALYAEDAVLIRPGNVFSGTEAVRESFSAAFEELKPASSQITIDSLDVAGEYALITWRLTGEAGEISFAANSFHVREGKIAMQTSGSVRE